MVKQHGSQDFAEHVVRTSLQLKGGLKLTKHKKKHKKKRGVEEGDELNTSS